MTLHAEAAKGLAYLIALAGIGLTGLEAVVPHTTGGHTLMAGLLLGGLVPYVVYVALSEWLEGWSLVLPGALLLTVDAIHTVFRRFVIGRVPEGLDMFYVPLVLTVIVLPLGIGIARLLFQPRA